MRANGGHLEEDFCKHCVHGEHHGKNLRSALSCCHGAWDGLGLVVPGNSLRITMQEEQTRQNLWKAHPFILSSFFLGGGLDLVDLFPALGSASVVGAFARCVAPDPNSWDSLTSTTGLRPGHWDEVLVILRIQVHSTLLSISRVLSCTVCCVLSYVFWQHLAKGLHMEFWESIGRSWVSEGKLCSLKHLAGGLGYAATGTS